ncbi:hypothetical protein GCK72_012518 [Caenorhabditis remanei]|uniref:PAN-3 domain-containing protein n=1 Tax=Caenorhabditis remanei TaxID=31234 RepID=A0A6A5GNC6_CAERE|nr:hypothetical protein GCK72_012518 [Caenorhabditis remanei]KAF1756065.1 hypothetical protein GCK72_012518 [Caenorhabditis remanei]
MMKIFGKVLDADLNDGALKPNAECVEECYQQSKCILVFMNSEEQCLSFYFNSTEKLTVVETAKTDNLFVAFKTQFLLSQCPEYEAMDLTVTVGGGSIPWIKNGNEYLFKKCVGDWKIAKRENNVTLCMQAFEIRTTSYEEAQTICEGQQKMMKIFGKVLDADLNGGISKPNAECVEECFQKSDCILVFMNSNEQCLSFNINISKKLTVVETTKEDKMFVAFKTQFSLSQCPAYEAIDLTVTVGAETVPWIKNGTEYTFKRCVEDWKMFERKNNVTVCMQTFEIGATSLEEAQTVCEDMGPYKLTGVQTEAELKWILGRLSSKWDEYYEGFWIDAKRQTAYTGKNDTVSLY